MSDLAKQFEGFALTVAKLPADRQAEFWDAWLADALARLDDAAALPVHMERVSAAIRADAEREHMAWHRAHTRPWLPARH